MSTLAKQWREKQEERRIEETREAAERNRTPEEVKAQDIIDDIPDMIEKAGGAESVSIIEDFGEVEVAGKGRGRLARLYADLRKRQRPLRASDLAEGSVSALVFAWCDTNDLECFLVRRNDWFGQGRHRHSFHIRPKKEAAVTQAPSDMEGGGVDDIRESGKSKKSSSYRL